MIRDKKKRGEIEELKWLVDVAENQALNTGAEKGRFVRECIAFVTRNSPGGAVLRIPGRFAPREAWAVALERNKPQDRRDWTENVQGRIQFMLHQALTRTTIDLPWPEWRSLQWDKVQNRYEEKPDYRKDNLGSAPLRIFANLLKRYAHLVKACDAPAPRKPGRKAKGARVEGSRTCGTVFVAERTTGAYCSDRCRNRVLTRSKREKEKRLKIRKRA